MQATTVSAHGEAEAPYTVAGFSIVLSDVATTVPVAKAKLKKQVETLNQALDSMKTKFNLEYIKNSVRKTSNVQEQYEYRSSRQEFIGYEVTYRFSFQIEELDKVNDIYDLLTSLKDVRVTSPTFGLKPKEREKLNKKAVKNAAVKVTERFETECNVLGLNSSDFEIVSWEVTYSDSQRNNRVAHVLTARSASNSMAPEAYVAVAGGGSSGGTLLDLEAGLASVVVNLEIGYAKRAATPVNATVVKNSVPNHIGVVTPTSNI
jgi:uncharacterized protein YggE